MKNGVHYNFLLEVLGFPTLSDRFTTTGTITVANFVGSFCRTFFMGYRAKKALKKTCEFPQKTAENKEFLSIKNVCEKITQHKIKVKSDKTRKKPEILGNFGNYQLQKTNKPQSTLMGVGCL